MKLLPILVLFLLLLGCEDKPHDYCGTVIDKGYDPPSSAYRSHTDPEYFVILRVDETDNNGTIRINTTISTYYSLQIGSRACFSLDWMEFNSYGNGDEDAFNKRYHIK